jgi:hypothetical protein
MDTLAGKTPLWPVFRDQAERMPRAFREQFLATPERGYDVVLVGRMERIWHNPRWLTPLFWFLGGLGILVPRIGEDIPATLTLEVVPGILPDGRPYHDWNRTFAFQPPVHFDTRVIYDEEQENLADQVGPGFRLRMVWKGEYLPPDTFTLKTVANGIRLGNRVRYLPRWVWLLLLGRVDFIQTSRPDAEDMVDVELRVLHPFFGTVFGYRGEFRAVRRPRPA